MKSTIFALALGATLANYAIAQPSLPPGCLYGITIGSENEAARACPEGDPLKLSENSVVKDAITALGLRSIHIRFWGCEKQAFAAFPDRVDGTGNYVISYPSDFEGNITAPLLHELSHVRQMEDAGGQQKLRASLDSIRIELGADYLAGIIYGRLYPDEHVNVPTANLLLTGLYREKDANAHGTPSQRSSAFRFGALVKTEQVDSDMSKMSRKFQRDVYVVVKGL